MVCDKYQNTCLCLVRIIKMDQSGVLNFEKRFKNNDFRVFLRFFSRIFTLESA